MPTPRLSGGALRALASLSRTRAVAAVIHELGRRDLRLGELADLAPNLFGDVPVDNAPIAGRAPRAAVDAGLSRPPEPWCGTSAARVEAYRKGARSPVDAVTRAIASARDLASRRPSVGPILDYREAAALAEAKASAERWRRGAAIGPLDGVPFAVKEEMAVEGLPVRAGSDLTDAAPAIRDGTCVAKLRAAGAIVIGTTPMTEYGMTPIGFNPKRMMPRNPHALGHVAGGSSTGSGVAVATGVVPFALGADGGGSIRIPAALCGVFGIKPTWGRVSRYGDVLSGSVGHVGPLASSTLDLAQFLDAACGEDPEDTQTNLAPPLGRATLVRALSRGVRGLRIGVEPNEWAAASPGVAAAGQAAIRALEAEGATIVDVRLHLAPWAAPIGYLTIGLEALAYHFRMFESGASFNADLAIGHAALSRVSAVEYAQAQRLRAGLRREIADIMCSIDVLALPTTVTTAAYATEREFEGGFIDPMAIDAMCRFNFLGNLTGLPALSAPVGVDSKALPIGLQVVGDAWDEATVLAVGAHLERIGVAQAIRPSVSTDPT